MIKKKKGIWLNVDEVQSLVLRITAEIAMIQARAIILATMDKKTCPTCGRPIENKTEVPHD